MATQNNKKEGFGESVINWLIPIYSNFSRSPLIIRVYEDWYLACFIKKTLKNDIKVAKIPKNGCFFIMNWVTDTTVDTTCKIRTLFFVLVSNHAM